MPIIARVVRRIHVKQVRPGELIPLGDAEAHHARDVLRLSDGARVEVFDDAGTVGDGRLALEGASVSVRVERAEPAQATFALTIAAAVPKGERADWMVEKLSELGVAEFIPLAAARSVVLPAGRGKRDRWVRIATEAAKQSRRAGVMRIAELTSVGDALRQGDSRWFLSTEVANPSPIAEAARARPPDAKLTAFIGPEGGWTAAEEQQFFAAGATPVRLTSTILRIETAAIATAAVLSCLMTAAVDGPLDARRTHDDDRATDAPAPSSETQP
jgi:16S rRNA (uracil1498-N3)-methyltransferase